MKPRIEVWATAYAGSSRQRCLHTVLQQGERVRWLFPSELHAQMARALLMAEGMSSRLAREIAHSFYEFALQIARQGGNFSPIPPYWRSWLLRVAAQQCAPSFCHREGMLRLLAHWLREVSREGITPNHLHQLASSSAEADKVMTLARIWEEYRRLLTARQWSEEEEVYAVAAQRLVQTDSPQLPACIIVEGYSHFSQGELNCLDALAQQGVHLIVVLPWLPGKQAFFDLAEQTNSLLAQRFEVVVEVLGDPAPGEVAESIYQLSSRLFGEGGPVEGWSAGEPAIEIWEAPNQLAEMELVARECVRAHRRGLAWGEIAVFCRDLPRMLPALEAVLNRFGVPYQHFMPTRLSEHPALRHLLTLLRLPQQDYPREEVLECLKSGYLPTQLLEADQMRRLAVKRGVRAGADAWQQLAHEAQAEGFSAGEVLNRLVEHLQAIWQAPTPQVWGKRLEEALQELGFGLESEPIAQAMEMAKQISALLPEGAGNPAQWLQTLSQAWDAVTLRRETALRNAVWLLETSLGYPIQPRLAFVVGMQEGRFPRRVMEDPLLRDAERQWLNTHVGSRLLLSHQQGSLERLLFLQTVSAARQRLILTYSRTEGEHDALPSFFVQLVREAIPPSAMVQRSLRLSEVTLPLDQALDDLEVEQSLVDVLFDTNPHTRRWLTPAERQVYAETLCWWLQNRRERCQRWWQWRYLPPFPRLTSSHRLLRKRAFSASELEQLQQCPFRHFVRWELKLRGEGVHYATRQGQWLHAVLRARYGRPDQPVSQIVQEVVQCHPIDRAAGERRLLVQQLEEMVQSVLEREQQHYSAFGLQTRWTERAFGPADDEEGLLSEPEAPPLRVTLPTGERIEVCGRIDRVDVCPRSEMAVLIDYKRNLPRNWWNRIQSGEDLQTVLYVAALRHLWKLTPAAVALDDALEGKRYRLLFLDVAPTHLVQRMGRLPQEDYSVVQRVHEERWRAIERSAVRKVHQLLLRRQAGDIRPIPGEHCALCEYSGLCRTVSASGTPVHDGEPYPSDSPDEADNLS